MVRTYLAAKTVSALALAVIGSAGCGGDGGGTVDVDPPPKNEAPTITTDVSNEYPHVGDTVTASMILTDDSADATMSISGYLGDTTAVALSTQGSLELSSEITGPEGGEVIFSGRDKNGLSVADTGYVQPRGSVTLGDAAFLSDEYLYPDSLEVEVSLSSGDPSTTTCTFSSSQGFSTTGAASEPLKVPTKNPSLDDDVEAVTASVQCTGDDGFDTQKLELGPVSVYHTEKFRMAVLANGSDSLETIVRISGEDFASHSGEISQWLRPGTHDVSFPNYNNVAIWDDTLTTVLSGNENVLEAELGFGGYEAEAIVATPEMIDHYVRVVGSTLVSRWVEYLGGSVIGGQSQLEVVYETSKSDMEPSDKFMNSLNKAIDSAFPELFSEVKHPISISFAGSTDRRDDEAIILRFRQIRTFFPPISPTFCSPQNDDTDPLFYRCLAYPPGGVVATNYDAEWQDPTFPRVFHLLSYMVFARGLDAEERSDLEDRDTYITEEGPTKIFRAVANLWRGFPMGYRFEK